jgi:hypothetical protein
MSPFSDVELKDRWEIETEVIMRGEKKVVFSPPDSYLDITVCI